MRPCAATRSARPPIAPEHRCFRLSARHSSGRGNRGLREAFEFQNRAFDNWAADGATFDELERRTDAGWLPAVTGRLTQCLASQATRELETVRTPANALRQEVDDEFAPFEPDARRAFGQLIERDHVFALGADAGAGRHC